MRSATIISTIFVLAACLLKSSDAVTCSAAPNVVGCIDCTTDPTNEECVAEAAANATTTTTTRPISTGGNRKIVTISDLNYSITRRVRLNNTSSPSTNRNGRNNGRRVTRGNSNRRNNNSRRGNSRNNRGNSRNNRGNIRVRVG
nr:GATA zinc finger domain-containing protein 21 [Drosophila suzukii]